MAKVKVTGQLKRLSSISAPANLSASEYNDYCVRVTKDTITENVSIELGLDPAYADKPPVLHVYGGPTGYESVYLDAETGAKFMSEGWVACAGIVGRWDSLFVPAEAIIKVLSVALIERCLLSKDWRKE